MVAGTTTNAFARKIRRLLEDRRVVRVIIVGWILVLVAAAAAFHHRVADTRPGREDTYFAWLDGERLAHGENPYERVLAGDMRTNDSYATYFPAYYVLSAGAYRLGVTDYMDWLKLWRPVVEASQLGIALLLLFVGVRSGSWAVGLWASGFWFFGRWTLSIVNMAHLDVPALFLMLLALQLRKRRPAADLLLGASMAVKQMALFFVPVWVIASYFEAPSAAPRERLRSAVRATVWTALVPAVLAAPFLIWNATGFVKSILFSATRDPASDFPVKSIDAAVGVFGLIAKIPMFGLMALVYLAVAMAPRKIGLFASALFIVATFLDFNSVLFVQYMVWAVPLVPLAWMETRIFPSQPELEPEATSA